MSKLPSATSAAPAATIDPAGRYTLAISDFLLTGAEANLAFLTRDHPDVSEVTEFRDIRLAVIDVLACPSRSETTCLR